jgi:hypothetical protein
MTVSTCGCIVGLLIAVLSLGSFSLSPSPTTLKLGGWGLIIGGIVFGASLMVRHYLTPVVFY